MRTIKLIKYTNEFVAEDGSIVVIPKGECLPRFKNCIVRMFGDKYRQGVVNVICSTAKGVIYSFRIFSKGSVIELDKPDLVILGKLTIYNSLSPLRKLHWIILCIAKFLGVIK
jgi:hypothetical protein